MAAHPTFPDSIGFEDQTRPLLPGAHTVQGGKQAEHTRPGTSFSKHVFFRNGKKVIWPALSAQAADPALQKDYIEDNWKRQWPPGHSHDMGCRKRESGLN